MIQILLTVDTTRRQPTTAERLGGITPESALDVRSEVIKAENPTTHEEQLVQGLMLGGAPCMYKDQVEAAKGRTAALTICADLAEEET